MLPFDEVRPSVFLVYDLGFQCLRICGVGDDQYVRFSNLRIGNLGLRMLGLGANPPGELVDLRDEVVRFDDLAGDDQNAELALSNLVVTSSKATVDAGALGLACTRRGLEDMPSVHPSIKVDYRPSEGMSHRNPNFFKGGGPDVTQYRGPMGSHGFGKVDRGDKEP